MLWPVACFVAVRRRLRKWYEEFQMWTLTGKPPPAPLQHAPQTSPAAAAAAGSSRDQQQPPQQLDTDDAAAAAGGGSGGPSAAAEFASFDEDFDALQYMLAAAQGYFSKHPTMTSFTIDSWPHALLDSMGLDRYVNSQDAALQLVEVSLS